VEDLPKLYITDLTSIHPSEAFKSAICIEKCPKKGDTLKYMPTTNVPTFEKADYDTISLLDYCFPSSKEELPEAFKVGWTNAKKAFFENPVGVYFNDIIIAKKAVYISLATSIIYSFIFIYLMSAFAEYIAWICIALA